MQLTTTAAPVEVGTPTRLNVQLDGSDPGATYCFSFPEYPHRPQGSANPLVGADQDGNVLIGMRPGVNYWLDVLFDTDGGYQLAYARHTKTSEEGESTGEGEGERTPPAPEHISIHVFAPRPAVPSKVALVTEPPPDSADSTLWDAIIKVTDAMRYANFEDVVARPGVLPQDVGTAGGHGSGFPDWYGVDAYDRLSRAARTFVGDAVNWKAGGGDPLEQGRQRSYVFGRRFTADADPGVPGYGTTLPLRGVPLVELIWNYWMEEGMLVQTLNHVLARFENRHGSAGDQLGRFDLNPLQPLRNLLWGFAEDERRRLTVRRRAAEYEYQYGLRLIGRAIPAASTVVERRTQFLEAFHSLLNSVHRFYKEHDDKTVEADAFPLLSGLREVHLLLAHGAHNQFADLAPTARAEMLAMQWILSRQEMRLFLGGPPMVPYEEPWMDRVDTMKELQGWPDPSITHFFDLAVHGERLVLSVRHGQWNSTDHTRKDAEHWALLFRESVQRYVHAYRAVTGADLTTGVDATMPSTLLARRMRSRRARA